MYYPESALEMGRVGVPINAPKAHQRIISKLTTGLGHLYYHQHEIDLEPLPETQIDEGQASPVPDIMLYDNETFRTPIIIEVCHPNGLNNDLKKIIRLIEENDYGIEEGFILRLRARPLVEISERYWPGTQRCFLFQHS